MQQPGGGVASADAETSANFIIIAAILSTIVLCTLVGNLFVIIAIFIDKNLQTPANQLVLSLAVADLMVACLVMPLGTYNDIYQGWWLGKGVCEFWTSADVLCCTGEFGSIFGLVKRPLFQEGLLVRRLKWLLQNELV